MSLFHRFPSPNDYPVKNISMEFIINFYHFSLWLLVTPFRMDWWKMHTFCCWSHRNNEIGWACNDQNHAIISIDQIRCNHAHTQTHERRNHKTCDELADSIFQEWHLIYQLKNEQLGLICKHIKEKLARPDRSINSFSSCC